MIKKNENQLDEAIHFYQRALAAAPNFQIASNNLAIAKTDLGTRLKNLGKVDEGIACYKEALAHNSKYPAAWSVHTRSRGSPAVEC